MVTPNPKLRPETSWFQSKRDAFQQTHLGDLSGLDQYEQCACEKYNEARAKVLIRVVTALILAAGTQQDAADRLGIDRTTLSVARNHGLLGSRPLANMFGNPIILANLLDRSPRLGRLMGRAGFITVAEFTAANLVRPNNPSRPLTELDYELLCGVVAARPSEDPSQLFDERSAAAIATRVLADPTLMVMPEWFTKDQRKDVKEWMKKLQEPDFATQHIRALQRDWIDIFVYVWATVEGEGDEDLWYAD